MGPVESEGRPVSGRFPWFAVGMGVLLVAAAFLRLETLGSRPLWYDERFTVSFCRDASSLSEVWGTVPGDEWAHPPLHYAVTYLVMRLSESAAAVRAASVVAGVGTVLLVGLIGRTLLGAAAGWLAALLLTVSVYHINYSMDARPYALMLFFLTGQFLALFLYRSRRSFWLLLPFVLCVAGAVYTHHLALAAQLAVAVIAAADLARLAFERRRGSPELARATAWYLAGALATALLYLPKAWTLLHYLGTGNLGAGHYLDLSAWLVWQLAARWTAGDSWVNGAVLVAFAAGVVGIVSHRATPGHRERRLEALSLRRSIAATVLRFDLGYPPAGLLVWLVVPFLPFFLVPFAKFFDIRFVIAALPPFLLVTAEGLLDLGRWVARLLPAARRRAWLRLGVPMALSLILVTASLRAYLAFRDTAYRCSEFFAKPELLARDEAFCRDHIILNSIDPEQQRLLRSVAD
jgi:4-amino-4-deoxy-L-arabinose transferase-like glycosyltransferase